MAIYYKRVVLDWLTLFGLGSTMAGYKGEAENQVTLAQAGWP